jgi:hypothetical protein
VLSSRVSGTQNVAGGPGIIVRSLDPSDNSVDSSIYVANSSGVRVYAALGSTTDPIELAFDGIQLLRWPAAVGDAYVQIDKTIDTNRDYDGDGRPDRMTLRVEATVIGREDVTTPAGTFTGTLRQRQTVRQTVLPSSGVATVTVVATADVWYASNVGTVKSVTEITGPRGYISTTTETLTGYRVGNRSSDSVTPTVNSVTPAVALLRGASVAVSATFSKAMDVDAFAAGGFTVVDSSNRPQAGSVQVQGNVVRFVPDQAWASGNYTARISTAAQDMLGNALVIPKSWTFAIDATGPGVVSSTPPDDAKDVALDTVVVLQFSEPFDLASVKAGNIWISDGTGVVPTVVTVSDSRLTITPTGGLQRAKVYTVNVSGITDTLGNAMPQNLVMQFRTTQGLFAYPVTLYPNASVNAPAIGDVNGDGINDVVFSTSGGADPRTQNSIYVRLGRVDGTLADPIRIDTAAQSCSWISLVIGDLDGDGRMDLVAGGNYCGALVLRQSANGVLVPGEFLALASSAALRLADLSSNGKLALVGVGGNSGDINVWRQDSTGKFVLSDKPPTISSLGNDIEVGDVNGDGRPDLVVAMNGYLNQHVAVLLQQADGTFAAPVYLSTGLDWGARAVALGDMNGDGRLDIVATTGGNSPTSIAVFYQGVGGTLGSATQVSSYDIPMAVRVADIDNDGRADLIVSHQGWSAVGIYLQQADGTLAAEQRFLAPYGNFYPNSLAVGDVTRDGRRDIVLEGGLIIQVPNVVPRSAVPSRSVRALLNRAQKVGIARLTSARASRLSLTEWM